MGGHPAIHLDESILQQASTELTGRIPMSAAPPVASQVRAAIAIHDIAHSAHVLLNHSRSGRRRRVICDALSNDTYGSCGTGAPGSHEPDTFAANCFCSQWGH